MLERVSLAMSSATITVPIRGSTTERLRRYGKPGKIPKDYENRRPRVSTLEGAVQMWRRVCSTRRSESTIA
jgi:hypothetical protein